MNQKKKIGNVQVAEENTPNQESKAVLDNHVSNDASQSTGPRLPIDLSSIDPAKIAMAEKFGIPISQILSWMASVEERFNSIEKVLPQQIAKELQSAIDKAKSEQVRPLPPDLPSPVGPNLQSSSPMAGLLSLLPTILQQSQGGTSDLLAELSAKALKGQIAMSEAITNAVVSKIAARATDEVAGAVTG